MALFWETLPVNLLYAYALINYLFGLPHQIYFYVTLKDLVTYPIYIANSIHPNPFTIWVTTNPELYAIFIGVITNLVIRFYYPQIISKILRKIGFYEKIKKIV